MKIQRLINKRLMKFVLTLLVMLVSCFYAMPVYVCKAENQAPIRIGATVSLDGKYSEPSAMIKNAYKLWEAQVNEQGGILGRPVKLTLYDDRSDEKRVRLLYEKLITEDRVDLVFSPYGTSLTLAASEVSERHGYVMLACGASGEQIWQRGFQYVFGMYALANRYFIGLLDLMARYGFESVGILYENKPFTIDAAKGSKTWAERFGLQVAYHQQFESGKNEMPGLLAGLQEIDPDGIILCAYPGDSYEFLRLLRRQAYRPKVLAMTIAPILPDFYNRAGDMAEKVFGPSQWEPDERIPFPGTKRFVEDFKLFAGMMPSYHAGSAYASCQIFEKAILHSGSIDNRLIRNFISSLDTVTVIGRFKVDHSGRQIGHNAIVIQWQKGEKQIVYPSKMQTAAPEF